MVILGSVPVGTRYIPVEGLISGVEEVGEPRAWRGDGGFRGTASRCLAPLCAGPYVQPPLQPCCPIPPGPPARQATPPRQLLHSATLFMGSQARPQLLNTSLNVPSLALLMTSDLKLVSRQHLIFALNHSSPVLITCIVRFLHSMQH